MGTKRFTALATNDDVTQRVRSVNEAQALASFPVKMPQIQHQGLRLDSWQHIWPSQTPKESRDAKVHADFISTTYVDDSEHYLHVVQGFTCAYYYWSSLMPPNGNIGTIRVHDKDGVWITAYPVIAGTTSDGKPIFDWIKGEISFVGWLDGVHTRNQSSSSDRYYGLVSDILGVDELAFLARSVPVTPLVMRE